MRLWGESFGIVRVLEAWGMDHKVPSDPTVSPAPPGPCSELTLCRTNLFPIHSWQVFPDWHHLLPCCCSSVPKLTLLLLDYLSPLSLGKITPSFINFLRGDTSLCRLFFPGGWLTLWLWDSLNQVLRVATSVSHHITPLIPDFWIHPSLTFALSMVTSHAGSCATR